MSVTFDQRPRLAALAALVAAGAWGFVSCSTGPVPAPLPPEVWPPPPAQARIVCIATVTRPVNLGAKVAGGTRFINWLTGSEKGDEPFVRPFGVALDEQQNLLVTDTGANAVGWLNAATHRWHRWDRIGGQPFRSPVAVAKQGNTIYVADSAAGEVVVFDVEGALKFRLQEGLIHPCALVLRGRQLLVADSQQHIVFVFSLAGRLEGQIGRRGTGAGEFNFPTHLATDASGRLYVTDSMNGRIQIFDADGRFIRKIGSPGDRQGHFGCPKGVAVNSAGIVYALDAAFDCLQLFDGEGRLLLSLGETGAQRGQFWLPNGIAVTSGGRIYVADSYNRRIQVFSELNTTLSH